MLQDQDINDVKLKVGLLTKDVEYNTLMCDKLSESIEKIQEMNMNLIKMIALHENKHEQHERVEEDLRQDYKELHSRITTINREIHDRIDQVERHITERIDALRSDLTNHKAQDTAGLGNRIANVEQWKLMVAGGVALGAWLLANLEIVGKFLK
jgi:chromosome segregation ATPase